MSDFLNNNHNSVGRGELIRVMGLWEEKDQNGNTTLSGSLAGRVRVSIVHNTHRQSEREPDYHMTIGLSDRPQQQGEEANINQEPPQEPQRPIRITGLWKNTDRKGNFYLNGSVQSVRILIFANSFHNSERDPDYILYVCQNQGQQQGQGAFGMPTGNRSNTERQGYNQPANPGALSNTADDEEVPF